MAALPPRRRHRDRFAAWLLDHWYRPQRSAVAWLLSPLARLYGALHRIAQRRQQRAARSAAALGVPVVVVGNLVAGGAGKTPVTIAIVQALRGAGHVPGVVSRGYGRRRRGTASVGAASQAADVGDEPLLIHRRTGAPVFVAPRRADAARALLAAHREVSVIVADDGLQHRALARDVEVIVFDERGAGNGMLLPAGPLREPMAARPPPRALVLYNHDAATTPWPGRCAQRSLAAAVPLADWLAGRHDRAVRLAELAPRRLFAAAGIAAPARFHAMLEAQCRHVERLPLPDHHDYAGAPPWPAHAEDVVVTEKDAVKLGRYAAATVPRIWVVPLDLRLPGEFVAELLRLLPPARPG